MNDNKKNIELIGRSNNISYVRETILKIAPTKLRVLIQGETGTGKELVANAIHQGSNREQKDLRVFNCSLGSEQLIESELFGHIKGAFTGAIKDRKGLFSDSNKGTLFLDEIGDMSSHTQAKVLRILENGEIIPVGGDKKDKYKVDVRIICATNKDLQKMIQDGTFRGDLYYRLKEDKISIAPLRERKKDIMPLVSYFIENILEDKEIYNSIIVKAGFLNSLLCYSWPGNVRELRNIIKRAVEIGIVENKHVLEPFGGIPIEIKREIEQICRAGNKWNAKLWDKCTNIQKIVKFKDIANYWDKCAEIVYKSKTEENNINLSIYTHEDLMKKYVQDLLNKTNGNKKKAAMLAGKKDFRKTLNKYSK